MSEMFECLRRRSVNESSDKQFSSTRNTFKRPHSHSASFRYFKWFLFKFSSMALRELTSLGKCVIKFFERSTASTLGRVHRSTGKFLSLFEERSTLFKFFILPPLGRWKVGSRFDDSEIVSNFTSFSMCIEISTKSNKVERNDFLKNKPGYKRSEKEQIE